MPGTIAFDVNETLLDLSALDPYFESAFGDRGVRKEWFAELLKQAFVTTITHSYSNFSDIGRSALLVMEKRHRNDLSEQQRSRISQAMQELPPHADVIAGFQSLRAAGWRLVALTNSTLQVAEAQLSNAGLRTYLDRVFSADSVQRLKPAIEPYQMAARELGLAPNLLMLAAAHAWDIAGALNAGCVAAFLSRQGQVLDSLTPAPQFTAADVPDLAKQLIDQQVNALISSDYCIRSE